MQSVTSSCMEFFEVMKNWAPNVTNGQATIATTLFLAGAGVYYWYNRESYVDQLFAKRITSVTPSLPNSQLTKKEALEQYFKSRGYAHLAVAQKKEALPTPIEQLDQYVKNPRLFDKAVAEFAKFAIENCQGNLCQFGCKVMPSFFHQDYWGNGVVSTAYLALSTAQIGDYESFPLCVEGGEGRIGIKNCDISLFSDSSTDINTRNVFMSLMSEKNGASFINELFMFFPFHKEIILKTLKRVYPSVSFDVQALNQRVKDQVEILKTFSKCHALISQKNK